MLSLNNTSNPASAIISCRGGKQNISFSSHNNRSSFIAKPTEGDAAIKIELALLSKKIKDIEEIFTGDGISTLIKNILKEQLKEITVEKQFLQGFNSTIKANSELLNYREPLLPEYVKATIKTRGSVLLRSLEKEYSDIHLIRYYIHLIYMFYFLGSCLSTLK